MAQTDIRDEILKEMQSLSSEKLIDLKNYVHNLKKRDKDQTQGMMRFAGSWSEMTDEDFQAFAQELSQRRLAKGRHIETRVD